MALNVPQVGSDNGGAWVPQVMTGELGTGQKTTEATAAAGGAPPVAQKQPNSNVGDAFTQSVPPKPNHVLYGPNGTLTLLGAEGRSYQLPSGATAAAFGPKAGAAGAPTNLPTPRTGRANQQVTGEKANAPGQTKF